MASSSNFLQGGYEGYAYCNAASSGIMAAGLAAASEVYQFRWKKVNNAAQRARVLAVYLSAATDATGFTAGSALFNMTVARAWTVDGSGGAAATPATQDNQLRTFQRPSLLTTSTGAIRVATTAALTAGTKTLDAQALGNIVGGAGAAGTQMIYQIPLYADWTTSYGIPLVLADQEGFVIKATVPATGTWRFGVTTLWAETD